MLLLACCLLLLAAAAAAAAKPGRSPLDTKTGYKTKTGSTSSVTVTLTLNRTYSKHQIRNKKIGGPHKEGGPARPKIRYAAHHQWVIFHAPKPEALCYTRVVESTIVTNTSHYKVFCKNCNSVYWRRGPQSKFSKTTGLHEGNSVLKMQLLNPVRVKLPTWPRCSINMQLSVSAVLTRSRKKTLIAY